MTSAQEGLWNMQGPSGRRMVKNGSIGRMNPRHDLRGDLIRQPVPRPPVCTVGLKLEANRKFGSRETGSKKTPRIKEETQPWVQVGYL